METTDRTLVVRARALKDLLGGLKGLAARSDGLLKAVLEGVLNGLTAPAGGFLRF